MTSLEVAAAVLLSCAAALLIVLIHIVTKSQRAFAESYLRAEAEDPFVEGEL